MSNETRALGKDEVAHACGAWVYVLGEAFSRLCRKPLPCPDHPQSTKEGGDASAPVGSGRPSVTTGGASPVGALPGHLRETLRAHYLAAIECDHEQKRDRASCSCSAVALPWCASVGEAVDSWIEHVAQSTKEVTDAGRGAVVDSGPASVLAAGGGAPSAEAGGSAGRENVKEGVGAAPEGGETRRCTVCGALWRYAPDLTELTGRLLMRWAPFARGPQPKPADHICREDELAPTSPTEKQDSTAGAAAVPEAGAREPQDLSEQEIAHVERRWSTSPEVQRLIAEVKRRRALSSPSGDAQPPPLRSSDKIVCDTPHFFAQPHHPLPTCINPRQPEGRDGGDARPERRGADARLSVVTLGMLIEAREKCDHGSSYRLPTTVARAILDEVISHRKAAGQKESEPRCAVCGIHVVPIEGAICAYHQP